MVLILGLLFFFLLEEVGKGGRSEFEIYQTNIVILPLFLTSGSYIILIIFKLNDT